MQTTGFGFKGWVQVAAALLLCGSSQAAEWTPLSPQSPPENEGATRLCSAENIWCASVETSKRGGLALTVERSSWTQPETILVDAEEYEINEVELWPQIYEVGPDQILVGVVVTQTTSYSGGGGSADWLSLYSVAALDELEAKEVLHVPMSSGIEIRACFDEEDVEKRLSVCHDQYDFTGSLDLAKGETVPGDMPDLVYATVATSFPGPVSRTADSTTAPALTEADLVKVENETCTYQRTYWFDTASGSYKPDTPEPECAEFTVP